MTCPDCGASNPADATWCNLCARPFAAGVITDSPPTEASREPSESAARPGVWRCAACETDNPLEVDRCGVCGSSIFDSFGRADGLDEQRRLAAERAWIPGWGHATLGDQGTAAMVVATCLVGLMLGVLLVLAPGTVVAGILCLLAAAGTWGATVVDVRRRAAGASGFLTGRRLLWVAVGVVIVALGAFVGAIDG